MFPTPTRHRLLQGLIQVYTGNGKGKTTAALGLALRAVGHGLKVIMIQFMKGRQYIGEKRASEYLPNFEIKQFGREDFVNLKKPAKVDIELAQSALSFAEQIIMSGHYDIVILDEVNVAIHYGLIDVNSVISIIKNKPRTVEIILTGRYAPKEIIELADLVTEMKEIKHPYKKNILARAGIDY
ncbi:MAG: cob(I)yrinic acid a,c-diamide adenosyltransferase [Candidatus Asgardarchaeia archaeon]